MREQFTDATGRMCRQPFQDVLQVQIGVMPVEPGRMSQAHHRSSAHTGTQAAGKLS